MKSAYPLAVPDNPGQNASAGVRRLRSLLPLLLFISLTAQSSQSQSAPLGRLFFTPERRAALERQRLLNIQEKTQETIEVANVHINGMVRRSNGKATVWVNGRPQLGDETSGGVMAHPSAKEPERVEIRVGDEMPASLRVGEKLNRANQEKTDGLAGGQVLVNRGDEDKSRKR
ncbi:MAG: hypothetical protein WC073_02800 [Sterolibacterium sp.]